MKLDAIQRHVRAARRALQAGGCLALLAVACWPASAPAQDAKPHTIRLVVDYGDGAQVHWTALSWREGMTVLDALAAAAKHPHPITFETRGTGASTLVTRIGDLKNEGTGRNWLYSVNGKLANVGAGAYQLKAGDAVLWEFKVYRYN
jgi:hypothetical protein